jgi:hypothetical protein
MFMDIRAPKMKATGTRLLSTDRADFPDCHIRISETAEKLDMQSPTRNGSSKFQHLKIATFRSGIPILELRQIDLLRHKRSCANELGCDIMCQKMR